MKKPKFPKTLYVTVHPEEGTIAHDTIFEAADRDGEPTMVGVYNFVELKAVRVVAEIMKEGE